jgi:hypothetical protein
MINLFQGGGLYSYGDANPLLNFQDWIQDAFAGQAGDTDPYAGYHYNRGCPSFRGRSAVGCQWPAPST